MSKDHGKCPKCEANWNGDKIPKDQEEFFGSGYFGRQVLYEDPYVYDGAIAVRCPDCSEMFPYGAGNLKVSRGDQRTVFEKWMSGDYYVD